MYRETAYFYLRNGIYDVTFAYRRSHDTVLFGAAFCNPKDQFSKTMGRKIAEGRMMTDQFFPQYCIAIDPGSTRFQVHDMLVAALSSYPPSPSLIRE
jgi:hypothetical protein